MKELRINATVIENTDYYVLLKVDAKPFIAAGLSPKEVYNSLCCSEEAVVDLTNLKTSLTKQMLRCEVEDVEVCVVGMDDEKNLMVAYIDTFNLARKLINNHLRTKNVKDKECPIITIKAPFDDLILFARGLKGYNFAESRYLSYKGNDYIEMVLNDSLEACSLIYRLSDYGEYTHFVPEQAQVLIPKNAMEILSGFMK
jgi:hypothetical protein